MKQCPPLVTAAFLFGALTVPVWGGGAHGVSGGVTLMKDMSARALALNGTIAPVQDEISAFSANPASLSSLQSGHASLHFERGMADDTFSQFMWGSPLSFGSVGLSIAVYDGGNFDWFDGNVHREVTGQKDYILGLGYAREWGMVEVGATAKYISSELIQMEKASALAADLGVASNVAPRWRVAASLQNFGTKMTYINDGDDLPRMFRIGCSYLAIPDKYPTSLLFELPFMINEQQIDGALGVETVFGPLAFRLGYKTGIDLGGVTMGAGFTLGPATLDYAFGLIQDLDSQHRVSLSIRFGGKTEPASLAKREIVPRPKVEEYIGEGPWLPETVGISPKDAAVTAIKEELEKPKPRAPPTEAPKVYLVKPGDTWKSIAFEFYGDERLWSQIYAKNRSGFVGGAKPIPGQVIELP